mgnify:FL=1
MRINAAVNGSEAYNKVSQEVRDMIDATECASGIHSFKARVNTTGSGEWKTREIFSFYIEPERDTIIMRQYTPKGEKIIIGLLSDVRWIKPICDHRKYGALVVPIDILTNKPKGKATMTDYFN